MKGGYDVVPPTARVMAVISNTDTNMVARVWSYSHNHGAARSNHINITGVQGNSGSELRYPNRGME